VQEVACDITKIDVKERARGPLRPSKTMISRHGILIRTPQNIIRTRKNGRRSCCQGKILKVLYVKIMTGDGEFYGKS
jgi:hypothetical protein